MAATQASLDEASFPGYFRDADAASLRGQRTALRLNRLRLIGAIVAALGGAFWWHAGHIDVWGMVAVIGFAVALAAELVLLVIQPERDWYAGRALAESAKTLVWRYAVAAEPFPSTLPEHQARQIMRQRLTEVAAKASDRITMSSAIPDITDAMVALRNEPFEQRRTAYVTGRTRQQYTWYAAKADLNRRRSLFWRVTLVAGETLAVVLACGRAFEVWQADAAGLLAALIASGAAWLNLKQHSALASAYSVAAAEIALQISRLSDTTEPGWAGAVADAEAAISREHTLWLASRSAGIS